MSQPTCATALLLASLCGPNQAATALPFTADLLGSGSRLSQGQPSGSALNLRATWQIDNGDVARAELLDERKFDSRGGIAAAAYTRVLTPDWMLSGSLAAGHGGLNWANRRVDLEVAKKWGTQGSLVTRLAVYRASFDAQRSDRGLRLGAAWYLPTDSPDTLVLEAGATLNTSQPGKVRSAMPFVAATFGGDGRQYFSVRLSHGSEAYQAIAGGAQLVDFKSSSAGLGWRRWMDPRWGLVAQAELYRNPSYRRNTLGAGAFAQW